MVEHLLVLSLGPVQEFIVHARRTRDLYAGSRLLSEAAQAVAESLAQSVGPENLIFPAPQGLDELGKLGQAGIPNVILARIPSGQDPRALGEEALRAARAYLRQKAQKVLGPKAQHLDLEAALRQVEDLLEGYYAYLPLPEPAAYTAARSQLMALLAARKNTRDFAPVTWGAWEPKSSLDGARESVLQVKGKAERLSLGLRPGEHLSGPDLLKRWWSLPQGFMSTSLAAALPWVEGLKKRELLGKLKKGLEALEELAGPEAREGAHHPVLKGTPLEGYNIHLLYENRLEEFPALAEDPERMAKAKERLQALYRELGRPGAYYALLHADGDRIGQALDGLKTPEDHRAFSRALALGFAARVREIVEAKGGSLVYAGGDDVLAILPLHTALATAWALAQAFGKALENLSLDPCPTLSVGLAIVHHLEPLQDALDLVRRAEKRAKEAGRNALAVVYSPRSGGETWAWGRWDEAPRLTQRLLRYADLIRLDLIPNRVAYELAGLLQEGMGLAEEALKAEALRVLGRKEMPRGYLEELKAGLDLGLERLAQELLLARPLAQALEQAGVSPENLEVWHAH